MSSSSRLWVPILLIASFALGPPEAAATPILDQAFEPVLAEGSHWFREDGTATFGQTFTAGIDGVLTAVEISATGWRTGVQNLDVYSIEPGGPPELLQTRLLSIVPSSSLTWFAASGFSIPVRAGEVLMLTTPMWPNLGWHGNYGTDATYAGGEAFYYGTSGWVPDVLTLWGEQYTVDFGFRTYVEPVPEFSSTLTLLLTGAFGLLVMARRGSQS